MEITTTQEELQTFAKDILVASGADKEEATVLADVLVWCDFVGRDNQGVWRLPILTERIEKGLVNTPCHYTIQANSTSAVVLDGNKGMGHYIAYKAMEEAINIAKKTGIAFVGVKDSNFFGAGAYYIEQAAAVGMIGIVASNSFPKVAAYNGVSSVLGTNPFAFSAPRKNGHSLLLDMATSASAGSSIRKCIEKGEELPDGIAVDSQGAYIKDPAAVEKGTILPFGGAKGYGLSLMVEILSGIITGAGYSHGVKSMYKNFDDSGDNGHFFIAIDIGKLMPIEDYYVRMESFISLLRVSGLPDESKPVLLPGECRWKKYEENRVKGLTINHATTAMLEELATRYRVSLPV